jgi:putative transposase
MLVSIPECRRSASRRSRYRVFVHEGVGETIWQGLRPQIYLGDDAFVTRIQRQAQIADVRPSVTQAQHPPSAPPAGSDCPGLR